jgi:hypothetical protein
VLVDVWRNFDVVPGPPSSGAPPGFYKLPFLIAGAFDRGRRFEIEAIARLPERSRVSLEMPLWLAQALRPHPCEFEIDAKKEIGRIALNPAGVQRLGAVILRAKATAVCRLLVRVPDDRRSQRYEVAVRQLYEKREVGRVTCLVGGEDGSARRLPKVRASTRVVPDGESVEARREYRLCSRRG